MVFWSATSYATVYVLGNCNMEGYCENDISGIVAFLLLLSFYWTQQVISNIVHVTVAGTVGTWWWAPLEANSCCSEAVRSSYIRAITNSFGSICFGSLLVAIVKAIKSMLEQVSFIEFLKHFVMMIAFLIVFARYFFQHFKYLRLGKLMTEFYDVLLIASWDVSKLFWRFLMNGVRKGFSWDKMILQIFLYCFMELNCSIIFCFCALLFFCSIRVCWFVWLYIHGSCE